MQLQMYLHTQIHVETRADTQKERHAHTAASDCLAYPRVASRDAREMDKKQCFLLYPLAVVWLVDFFCTH